MNHFVHPAGICETENVGGGTRIWAFAHVLPGAVIGADCNVCDHVFIENDVVVGDRVTIKSGVQLWDGVRLADDVFIGPNVSFANDKFPRSRQYPENFAGVTIAAQASIGAGATLLPGVRIGRNAMVGAGSVVTRDVPANAIVVGNPARIVGYADGVASGASNPESGSVEPLPVGGASIRGSFKGGLIQVKVVGDLRGSLAAVEFGKDLPFEPARLFAVFDVPTKDVRGEHAHRRCEQVLVCLRGSVTCIVDDGTDRQSIVLDDPSKGLYMPAMTWGTQYRYTPDALLVVLASLPYDNDDYIREYEEFLAAVQEQGHSSDIEQVS